MALTAVAKIQIPPPTAARAVVNAPLSAKELAARAVIRELVSALGVGDENAYLALWHFDGEDAPKRRDRVLEKFRERPDRREGVARGLPAAPAEPNAVCLTGVDESMATLHYAYRNFRRDRKERATLVRVDGLWRITHFI